MEETRIGTADLKGRSVLRSKTGRWKACSFRVELDQRGHADDGDHHAYAEDGTAELKRGPILRSKTGRWRACSFILGYQIFERSAHQGIVANLVPYLTRKLHQGTVKL